MSVGNSGRLRLALETTVKSGTNPTLDVTVQTSFDGVNEWRTVGTAFSQQTNVGLAMTAVTEAGTTPPDITLTGTPVVPVNLRIECTTLGARGTAVVRYSIDGGVSWTSAVATAATFAIGTTGLTANYESATAAVDNVWTARSAGWERKSLSGLSRFVRAVAQVGGTSTPIFTASLTGESA